MSSISNSIGTAYSPPANAYAQKADCERQLADWEHCVSASTPRGKEKIEELRTRLKEIEADLKTKTAPPVTPTESTKAPTTVNGPDATYSIGSLIDVRA